MVTITILSLDRKEDIDCCLTSLYRSIANETCFEVIIIDQNSNAETRDFLIKLPHQNLKVIFLKENIGCARGRKKAFDLSNPNSEFIFQVDNDIVFTDGWLEQLLKDIQSHTDIGAMQARCVSPTGLTLLGGGFIERFGLNKERSQDGYIAYFKDTGSTNHMSQNENGLIYCDYLSGGATLFRRSLLEDISYDENYLNGYEDYDLSIKARAKGWLLACNHNVTLIHNNRRFKDAGFLQKEQNYIKARENSDTLCRSLINFIKKHNMNPIRSDGFDAIIKDENGKPFSEYSDVELKLYFDRKI